LPKYDNIETIPARTFFQILETKDYQLLKPKPKENNLEAIFMEIYDSYFIQVDDPTAKRYLKLSNEITALKSKRELIRTTLAFVFENYHLMTKEMQNDLIQALEIDINPNDDILDQIKHGLTFTIGEIENDLVFLETEFSELQGGNNKPFDFFKQLASISSIHKMQLNPKISLAEFVAYQKIIK
jgi:hypothetical protein